MKATDEQTDVATGREPDAVRPRWMTVLAVVAVVLVVLAFLALHLSGAVGPDAH